MEGIRALSESALIVHINVMSDAMKLETFSRNHPVFTSEDLTGFLASEKPRGPGMQDALFAYRVKDGRLVRVSRGLYAVVPPGAPRKHIN